MKASPITAFVWLVCAIMTAVAEVFNPGYLIPQTSLKLFPAIILVMMFIGGCLILRDFIVFRKASKTANEDPEQSTKA